ncbi:dephospho-CoA kinase [Burkholderiaceae bacterium DAT-1]|nr:dephospho-CoA kinase [Burkholderiaceae bacterium DAT-1]
MKSPLVIGLTGGIGSGKTQVSNQLAALGAHIVDTDVISHTLCAPDQPGNTAIRQAFGSEYFHADGTLDRDRLRELVFKHPDKRKILEAALHPLIRDEAAAQLLQPPADAPYSVLVVPLMNQATQLREMCNRILVVDCDEETQIQRVQKRSHLSRQQVESILATQAKRHERLAIADDIISNDGEMAALITQIVTLHQYFVAISAAKQQI